MPGIWDWLLWQGWNSVGGSSLWSGHSASTGPVIVGVGAVCHLMSSPPDRKRVMHRWARWGLPPSSSLRSNLTCFLVLSLTRAGGSTLPVPYSWDLWVLCCIFRSLMKRHSCSLEWPDLGGLGKDDEDCFCHFGWRAIGAMYWLAPAPQSWEPCLSAIQTVWGVNLPLAIWQPSLPVVLQRMINSSILQM